MANHRVRFCARNIPSRSLFFLAPCSLPVLLLLFLLNTPASAAPMQSCRNDCDFFFEGFENGTIPTFSLAGAGAAGAAVIISPRVLYGKKRAVQVHASGPVELLGRMYLKNTVDSVRRLAQKSTKEAGKQYIEREALDSEHPEALSSHLLLGGPTVTLATSKGGGAGRHSKKAVRYAFFVGSINEGAPAFLYQEAIRDADRWRAARGRCFRVPLIKLRVYYWRTKFVYVTEGDGNTFFPEARRCVVFRTR